jgi:hypothetical protein
LNDETDKNYSFLEPSHNPSQNERKLWRYQIRRRKSKNRTDNTMAPSKRTERQTMFDKTLHRKLNTDQPFKTDPTDQPTKTDQPPKHWPDT